MRLGRGPREVYRVYGEDEAPDVDEWAGAEAQTREFAVECPPPETREFAVECPPPETREFAVECPLPDAPAAPPRDEPRFTRPSARLGQARRVAVMTLLGVGVGLVAALALHSLRGSAVVDGRRAGQAGQEGAALWPSTSPPEPVAAVPAEAQASRTVRAPVQVAAVSAPGSHIKTQRESGVRHESVRSREHDAHGSAPTRHAASAAYTAVYPIHSTAATAATPSQGTAEAQPAAEAASEFTFER